MSKKYKIDKNIAVPENVKLGRKTKYPFGELRIGESFFVNKSHRSFPNVAISYGQRNGKEFRVQRAKEKGKNGFRIWRIK